MKILYLECGMGAAGDMLTAALLEMTEEKDAFLRKMNGLGLPGVRVEAEKAEKCGIVGTRVRVTVDGEEEHSHDRHGHEEHGHHHHTALADIEGLIGGLDVSEKVKKDALSVYRLIAEAESRAHGKAVEQIHFHEVGALDAVADVVGVCLLMEKIAPDRVIASPVHVGSGSVRCAHGVLPVPAPATARLLENVPTYGGGIEGELCTPTGAALLRHFAERFGPQPLMAVQKIGCGMGAKDFERANCLRAFLGEADGTAREKIAKLECNLDDMTGEDIAYACERLFAVGARDVYTVPVGMKKGRPGVLLCCVCLPGDAEKIAGEMLKHTTTLGVRRQDMDRYVLERRVRETETPFGTVRVKEARGGGVRREKPEFEDLAGIARETGKPLAEIRRALAEKK